MNNKEQIGSVTWLMKGTEAGYKTGLGPIEKNRSFQEFSAVFWFCREIAIAQSNPGDEFQNIPVEGEKLVADGQLTPQELKDIYECFAFDPSKYTPPNLQEHSNRFVSELRKRLKI